MARLVKYDVSGVEEGAGGGGEQPKPSVYVAEIVDAEQRTQKSNGDPANDIHIRLNIGGDYVWLHTYIGLSEASDWKMAEFVRALGLKDKGSLDLDKIKGKLLRVKVNPDNYEGQYVGKAGRLMKAQSGDEILEGTNGAVEEDEEGPEDEADGVVIEAEAEEDLGDFVASREGDEGVGSYDDWTDDDLAAEVEDRGLTLAGGRGNKLKKMVAALRADDLVSQEEDEEEAEEEESEPDDDYDSWDIDKLKEEWNDREFGDLPSIKGRNAAGRLKDAIIEELRKDDEENPFEG